MTSITELQGILEKYGYKVVKFTRFSKHDRLKIEKPDFFLTLNYRKHLEDFTLQESCEGLLSKGEFLNEFGVIYR